MQLREHYGKLTESGAQVIVIVPSTSSFLEKFIDAFGPFSFPIYGDPDRELYRSMGHKSMAKWKLLAQAGKGLMRGGSKTFLPEDERQKELVKDSMKNQDVYIQGGAWIYDENGKVIWSHVDESPEDHAPISELINRLQLVEK